MLRDSCASFGATYFFSSEFELSAAMSWWLSRTGQAIMT
jgi:hypothetical protein